METIFNYNNLRRVTSFDLNLIILVARHQPSLILVKDEPPTMAWEKKNLVLSDALELRKKNNPNVIVIELYLYFLDVNFLNN